MNKHLKLFNDEINVDTQKFLDGKLLLQANTGGGKSWATRRIIEQFAGIVPQIILDPEGEFFTLRQKFPDFILIGKGQAITADPKSAALLAHKIIEERISCIIDLLEMKPLQRDEFVKNFIQALVSAPRNLWLPTLITIDEAQIFAPENGHSEVGSVLADAGFRFRKRHFGLILATPRISELSKSVASTCKNKLIGEASLDNDMKRAASALGFTTKEETQTLRELDPGEFYAYGPAFSKKVIKLKIGKTQTQHGDSAAINARVAKPSEKVQKALEVLANVPQEAEKEAKTTRELQTELVLAKRQIQTLERDVKPQVKTVLQVDQKAVAKAIALRDKEWSIIVEQWRTFAHNLRADFTKMLKSLEWTKELKWPEKNPPAFLPDKAIIISPATVQPIFNTMRPVPIQVKDAKPDAFIPNQMDREFEEVPVMVAKGEMEILKAIASDLEGITTEHIAVLTGYKATSRREYLRKLVVRNFIEKKGEIYIATQQGIAALGPDYEIAPTGIELQQHVLARMDGGEKKIFEALLDNQPEISKADLQNIVQYKNTSMREYLRKLLARKLIVVNNEMIRLSEKLL